MSDRPNLRLVLLDRDGVINADSAEYVKSVAEWHPLPGSIDAIARLSRAGFGVVVVTNQSGIGRGLFDQAALEAIHTRLRALVAAAGGRLDGIYVCPHRPDEGCECRKPRPGLLERIARDFGCDLTGVPFIGDKASDVEAARAVGARPILVGTGLRALGEDTALQGIETHADLAAAAASLIAEASA